MKILLTGATGFLGSHLARRLVSEGHDVRGIKRISSSLLRIQDIAEKIDWIVVDPNGNFDSSAFAGVDVVIHAATTYGRTGEAITDVANTNTQMPLRYLEAAIQHGIQRFINSDSALPESTNAYSLSKAQFAQWGRLLAESGSIRFCNVRLEHFYGPGDDDTKFTHHVINACLKNEPELRLTEGSQKRDFIYVGDVVDAYLLLINHPEKNSHHFVEIPLGSGTTITIRELVETIHTLTNSSTRLLFGALPAKPTDVRYSCADLSLIQWLGWMPLTTLQDGLGITIESARQS